MPGCRGSAGAIGRVAVGCAMENRAKRAKAAIDPIQKTASTIKMVEITLRVPAVALTELYRCQRLCG